LTGFRRERIMRRVVKLVYRAVCGRVSARSGVVGIGRLKLQHVQKGRTAMRSVNRIGGLLVAVALSLGLAGCDDEKDDGGGGILGTWLVADATAKALGGLLTLNASDYPQYVDNLWSMITFNADGTCNGFYIDGSQQGLVQGDAFAGTYSQNGNNLTVTGGGQTASGTYGVNGDRLTFYTTRRAVYNGVSYDFDLEVRLDRL
jgi:hypothetical protein